MISVASQTLLFLLCKVYIQLFLLSPSEMEAVTQLHVVIVYKKEGIISFTKPLTQHYLYFLAASLE